MKNNFENNLNERFKEYQHFIDNGIWQSALIKLAEINNVLSSNSLSKKEVFKWKERINNEFSDHENFNNCIDQFTSDFDRVNQIISVGEQFNDDEFVLILTLLIQIELTRELFESKNIEWKGPDNFPIEKDIEVISGYKGNNKAYQTALSQVKNNWGLPIISKWFK